MVQEERRRDYRFAVTLTGSLARGRVPIWVENVAYRGLLVTTSAPITPIVMGQLGQFRIVVPELGSVVLHGVPVRVDGAGETITLGVRLLGVEPRWEGYIRRIHAPAVRLIHPGVVANPDASEAP